VPPARRALRETLRNLALAVGSLVAMFAILEGGARLARHAQGAVEGGLFLYSEHDPLLGWRKKPGARARFRTPEYTTEVVINSHGLRDPERGYEAPAGTLRVLALGDSFVEAYGVPLADSVTQVLEASLRRSGRPAEVINAGTTAYSTDQEYLFYKSEGVRYSPAVVVLFFYYNDVVFNARAGYRRPKLDKPVFLVDGGRLVLRNVPVPEPSRRSEPASLDDEPPPERSALFAWVRDRLRTGAPEVYARGAAAGLWPPLDAEYVPPELKVYKRRGIPAIRDAWERTGLVLEELARQVEADGARFLLAYVPSAMEVNDRAWRLTCLEYGVNDEVWDRGAVWRHVEQIASGRFPALDLTPALRAADHGLLGGPYYPRDGHWNAAGHAIAAREVESFLGREGWLSGRNEQSRQAPTARP
jgi:hypothetical protein